MKTPQLPAGLKKVHTTAVACIKHLASNGIPINQAETMVMDHLQESHDYLQAGLYEATCASLKMTFLNQSARTAALDMLNALTENE